MDKLYSDTSFLVQSLDHDHVVPGSIPDSKVGCFYSGELFCNIYGLDIYIFQCPLSMLYLVFYRLMPLHLADHRASMSSRV